MFNVDIRDIEWWELVELHKSCIETPVENTLKTMYIGRISDDVETLKHFFGEEKWQDRGGYDNEFWQSFRNNYMNVENEEEKANRHRENFNAISHLF